MRRLLYLLLLLSCSWPAAVWAQKPKRDSTEVLKQLLAMPAPRPGENDESEESEPAKKRPDKFFSKENVPPDDAPIDDLLDYWNRWTHLRERPEPSNVVKQRIFDATAGDYERLSRFLPVLGDVEPIAVKVKAIYDRIADDELNQYQAYKIKEWLVHNTRYFMGELLARANAVNDNSWSDKVAQERALIALAKVDWETAEPLLQSFAATSEQGTATVAISLLYKHAISAKSLSDEEKFRERLQSIASDQSQPGRARNEAIEVLSKTEWAARDDWYLSLFNDESLIQLRDGTLGFTPLDTLFGAAPDKWIPIMAKLVGGNNRALQQTAASCLVRYATSHPRRDAMLPVLRWLSEPDWLQVSAPERASLMQRMDQVDIPESIPGLMWVVENDDSNAPWAARTLGYYKDPRAIPALKKALVTTSELSRGLIVEGLLATGGLTETEAVDALETYAEKLLTPEGEAEVNKVHFEEPLPVQLSIGRHLAIKEGPPAWLVQAVLARVASLRKRNAPLAQALVGVVHQWQGRQVDVDIIQRIAAGSADATTITTALNRRTKLRESLRTELQGLLQAAGIAPAIGAVLLDDTVLARTIISSGDHSLQTALLAAARLTQTPLPVDLIGAFLKNKNALLAQAAERYLLAEDSKEARTLLWQRHSGEAFVTGWRENVGFFADGGVEALEKIETDLRAELFKENGPTEIFALFVGPQDIRVLRNYRDRATYTHHDDSSRYAERTVLKAEVAGFKDFLTTNKVSEMRPQFGYCHYGCQTSQFLMLTKEEGRRVLYRADGDWKLISESLDELGEGSVTRIHYKLQEQIKGVQVLYADRDLRALDVSLQGEEIRVYVERAETDEDIKEALLADDETKEAELKKARFTWRKISGNKLGDVTTPPDGYPSIETTRPMFDMSSDDNNDPARRIGLPNGKVFVHRPNNEDAPRKAAGPDQFSLLDPSTGEARPVTGELAPLLQIFKRFLQTSGKADEFWAAIPDETKVQTKVGRYNLKTFSFTPVVTIPHIAFDSMSMWVDEKHERILLVYFGQLLSIPLKSGQ